MKKSLLIMVATVIPFALIANSKPVPQIELGLNWKAEPEFGGFYAGKLNGHYQALGMNLTIREGGAGQPVAQMVGAKKIPFGIAAAEEVILARSKGAKIVSLFTVYQDSPQGFMVHESRNLNSLQSLFQSDGTIAIQKGFAFSEWLIKKYAPIKAKLVPYTGGITQFIDRPNFAQQCFVTSEPLAAKKKQQKIRTFMISESGYNPYLATVITHEDVLKEQPKLVEDFIKATQQGWADYLKSPEKTNELMAKINSNLGLDDFNAAAKLQIPFIENEQTKKLGLGIMTIERWTKTQDQLIELGLLKTKMDPASFFRLMTKN